MKLIRNRVFAGHLPVAVLHTGASACKPACGNASQLAIISINLAGGKPTFASCSNTKSLSNKERGSKYAGKTHKLIFTKTYLGVHQAVNLLEYYMYFPNFEICFTFSRF